MSPGNRVELQINGFGLWAEVTASNGHNLEGLSLEALEASNGTTIEIGDELQSNFSNIVRCTHSA